MMAWKKAHTHISATRRYVQLCPVMAGSPAPALHWAAEGSPSADWQWSPAVLPEQLHACTDLDRASGSKPLFLFPVPMGSVPWDGPMHGPYPKVIALGLCFRKLLKRLGEQRYSRALPSSSGRKMCFPKQEFPGLLHISSSMAFRRNCLRRL